ncbi:capsular exopolysaccharide family [Paenibacillus curdlanolyticus YK9]|uniref:non-specific protein-tyrosine kinase n=1 Tax=Paenibacillus curdlanolyticus YK9 TaxID=717606 RepID=E0I7B5_9BACL|nr:CpsD/CapB family tyrosine-protein kinase [Paenibacillus curdlanolyticus]EFM11931.1 capsular exopolysaccharide family [Paenibacillus curdlanolyticus YK9]
MSRQNSQANLITISNPKSPISEAYRTLRTNIQFSSVDEPIKVIMIASAQAGEGKTTTVTNLAITYAMEGKRVLLIDADLRKPSLHRMFDLSNRIGLTNLLAGQFHLSEVEQATLVDNLTVIPSGPVPPNPSELLGSQKMKQLLAELKNQYDMILIDTPPNLAVPDGMIISANCDGVVLVVQAGKVKRDMVRKAKTNLDHVNARILGVVLNNVERKQTEGYYYYYYGSKE